MATPRYAVCRLSNGACLESRCPLADLVAGIWVGCREGWLRWELAQPRALDQPGKARLNLYLRLHDLPIPIELRLAPAVPAV